MRFSIECTCRKLSLLFFAISTGMIGAISAQQSVVITGRVVDAHTGMALESVNIGFVHQAGGTISKTNGGFRLVVKYPAGDSLQITHIGYKPLVLPLVGLLNATQPLIIRMEPVVLPMPAINVSANRYQRERSIFMTEPSPRFLSADDIMHVPTFAVPDLHRAMQSLPGVVSTNEITAQLSVRGGNTDQNLMLLDGAMVYHPYHMGLLSGFNVDIIDAVNMSAGGFSARYGNKLSAVMSLHTKQPNKDFQNRASISLINADMTLGGKIGNKLGWLVSGRRNYYDLIAKMIGEELPLSFQDYYGKLTFQPNAKHFLSLSAYGNTDSNNITDRDKRTLHSAVDDTKTHCTVVTEDRFNIGNQLLSFLWDFQPFANVQTTLQLTTSRYQNTFHKRHYADYPDELPEKFQAARAMVEEDIALANQESGTAIRNSFRDNSGSFSFTWTPIATLHVESGVQYSQFRFDYGWQGYYDFGRPYVNYFFDYSPEDVYSFRSSLHTAAGYAEVLWDVTARLHLRQGIRVSRWQGSNQTYFEPRLNVKYDLSSTISLVTAYGYYTQGIGTGLENGLVQMLELYFPAVQHNRIEMAQHFILNLVYDNHRHFRTQITGYYKPFGNLLKSVLVDERQQFTQVNGDAYGLEMELQGSIFEFQYSASYVYSHSRRMYQGIRYDTNFDRRHRVYTSLTKRLGNWEFSASWELYSGQPYNPGRYRAIYKGIYYASERNRTENSYGTYEVDVPPGRIRYPWYHRLDLAISWTKQTKHFSYSPYLSIRNVYNRKNVLYYRQLNYRITYYGENYDQEKYTIERDPFWLPIIPTFGVRFVF